MSIFRPLVDRLRGASRLGTGLALALVMAASVGSTGCIKKTLAKGQIKSTREGSAAFQTTADFETARIAASAGIAQFEGMHMLVPDDDNAYYLLIRGWASLAFAFVEDDLENAILTGDEDQIAYQRARAKSMYTRAVNYGLEWMEHKNAGVNDAIKHGSEKEIQDYVQKFDDADDADFLFWTGQAWMARANVDKADIGGIGQVFVGRTFVERAAQLKDDIERGSAHVLLGSYYARTGFNTLGQESFDKSKAHFDKAMQINGGKVLLGRVQFARTYACRMKDDSPGRKASFEMYMKLLNEVLEADDPLPEARLTNAIAKRKARRYTSKKWIDDVAREDCGWEL
ncbi:MAG: hypothetical protein HYV09_01480 [Deltaproteobacteria bacterium]|nr:hypothetical protein [Deltaproteobacteria bacterium]